MLMIGGNWGKGYLVTLYLPLNFLVTIKLLKNGPSFFEKGKIKEK